MQKLVFQFAAAGAFLFSMKDYLTTDIAVPFTDKVIPLGIFYWAIALLFIVFVVNAVNLTDGIDGLAASTVFVLFTFFLVLGFLSQEREQILFSSAVMGGMIGFLIYNLYPARIFMGDTGSLFLGGAVAGFVFWLNNPLMLFLVAFVFIWEALSVVLQVGSYKITKKRIFKMAPFHHHLEMCGWKEPQIVSLSCIVTALFCAAAYFVFYC